MLKYLPPKRDSRWFLVGASIGLFSFIVYFLAYTQVLGGNSANMSIPGALLFFVLVAELFALFGFLGLNWLFIISTSGLLGSLAWVITLFAGPPTGWEDLIGILMMLTIIAGGLVLGIIVELILFIIRKVKANK